MNLVPAIPPRESDPRYIPRLVESSWIVLDRVTGAPLNQARYTVEIQARWTAEAMEKAYQMGLIDGQKLRKCKFADN